MAAQFVRKDTDDAGEAGGPAHTDSTSPGRACWHRRLLQPLYAGLAPARALPSVVSSIARGLLLDSVYTEELDRQLSRGD